MGTGNEKRALNKKAFESSFVQKEIGEYWIYDKNKIAYSAKDFGGQKNIVVDFDKEQNREPRTGRDGEVKPDTTRVTITKTKTVRLDSLRAYLDGTLTTWNADCLEAISKWINQYLPID